MAAAAQPATSRSVTGMAHQIKAGPSTAGSSKISAPLMTSTPRDGDEKRSARLEDGLKIIRGKDIQRQQQERHDIRPDDARRHGEDRRRRRMKMRI